MRLRPVAPQKVYLERRHKDSEKINRSKNVARGNRKKREGRAPLGLIQKNSVLRALVMTSMSTLLPMTRIARISSVATGQTIMLSLLS